MLSKPIVIAIILLVASLFAFFVIFPKKEELSDLGKRVAEKEQELKIREDYSQSLKDISQDLESYQSQLAKIKMALPEGSQPLVFYNFLQKTTSRAGLVLRTISHSEGLGTITLNLAVSGSLDSFRNFLFILEKSARLIEIESFSFSSPEKEKDPVNFNLKIKAYFIE